MTFAEKLVIFGALSAAIGVAVTLRPSAASLSATPPQRSAIAIAVIAAALLMVGIVSSTLPIHLVQIAPAALVLALFAFSPGIGRVAAVPLFAFWLLIMAGIWLFLLGVARIFTGTFTLTEVALTLVIGVAAIAGLSVSASRPSRQDRAMTVMVIVLFAALQATALWCSYLPAIISKSGGWKPYP